MNASQNTPVPIGVVLAALRDLEISHPDGVPVADIRNRAWERGVSYDSTHLRLNELIESGLAVKVRRGYYLPGEADNGGR